MFYRNIKTGKVYSGISSTVINSTNNIEGSLVMVLYKDSTGQLFVRTLSEFYDKFELVGSNNTSVVEMEEISSSFSESIQDTRAKEPTLQGKIEDLNIAFNALKAEVDKRFEEVFSIIGSWKMVIETGKSKPTPGDNNWYQDIWKKGTSVSSFCDCGTEPNGTDVDGRCGVCGNKLDPSLFRSSNDLQFKAEYFNSPMVEDTFDIEDILTEKHECKVCGRTFTDSVELYHHYDLAHNKGLEE